MLADLFNACANAPPSERQRAFESALHLKKSLNRENVAFSRVMYHNAIKAFGRCGDLALAFSCADEMRREKLMPDVDTYAHLLQACISEQEAGFRHALLVWRTMLDEKKKPDQKLFHLMLRAARDCGVGRNEFNADLILACLSGEEVRKHRQKLLEGPTTLPAPKSEQNILGSELSLVEKENEEEVEGEVTLMPNLLAKKPNLTGIVGLGSLDNAQNRFLVLGGVNGVLAEMAKVDVKADSKTFTQTLDLIDNDIKAETELMTVLTIKPEVGFFNALIKRRALRLDYEAARGTLETMAEYRVAPDILTYGGLAMCTRESGRHIYNFLADLKRLGVALNVEIASQLVGNAVHLMNGNAVAAVLKMCKEQNVKPNRRMLKKLDGFNEKIRDQVLLLEKTSGETVESLLKRRKIHTSVVNDMKKGFPAYRNFRETYLNWLREHPWRQFLSERDLERSKKNVENSIYKHVIQTE